MTLKEAAEKYYWAHTQLHEASKEQEWLKDVVIACFQDGAKWAYEDAAKYCDEVAPMVCAELIRERMSEGDE